MASPVRYGAAGGRVAVGHFSCGSSCAGTGDSAFGDAHDPGGGFVPPSIAAIVATHCWFGPVSIDRSIHSIECSDSNQPSGSSGWVGPRSK